MRIARAFKRQLTHRDRWSVDQMLTAQSDLREPHPARDVDLWRHLFSPDDLVRVGDLGIRVANVESAEFCWGNTWRDGVIVTTVAVCRPALTLLRGATYIEAMSRSQACEAVLGRLRACGTEIVMVVDDGDGGLECWIDPAPGSYPIVSKGRCPGGRNSKTGRVHRVVWADPATRIDWEVDEVTKEVP